MTPFDWLDVGDRDRPGRHADGHGSRPGPLNRRDDEGDISERSTIADVNQSNGVIHVRHTVLLPM